MLVGVLVFTTGVTAFVVGFGDELELVNLLWLWVASALLFVAFMALAFAVSVESDRAGPAIGIPAIFVLLNYLAFTIGSIWPDAKVLEDWSMFHLLKARRSSRMARRWSTWWSSCSSRCPSSRSRSTAFLAGTCRRPRDPQGRAVCLIRSVAPRHATLSRLWRSCVSIEACSTGVCSSSRSAGSRLAVDQGWLEPDIAGELGQLWPLILVGIGLGLILRWTPLSWFGGAARGSHVRGHLRRRRGLAP